MDFNEEFGSFLAFLSLFRGFWLFRTQFGQEAQKAASSLSA
jgi:hypothetical protein